MNLKKENIKVYIGEVNECLVKLPKNSIDCVITSPPYWKQRDYKHPEQIGQEKTYIDYVNRLVEVFNKMKRVLKPTGTFFLNVGYKWKDKELLLIPELLAAELQKNGWALLNKIIWNKPNAMPSSLDNRFSNVYEPVFLFVKNKNKYNYYFSIDELRKPNNNSSFYTKKPEDIMGFKVRNSLFKNKKGKTQGRVEEVFKTTDGNILAQVKWINGETSLLLVNDFNKESQMKVDLICPACRRRISNGVDADVHLNCKGFPRPLLPSKSDFDRKTGLKKIGAQLSFLVSPSAYNGKYKVSPENRGASPGARKSLFGEYLVLQRRYKIVQPIIAGYLKFWRKKKSIPIKEIDKLLGYKDTAGHWFRKDTGSWGRGGAVPPPDDWVKLKEILGFDDKYDRWVTEYHLVLQTVKPHPGGRNPGDMWSINTQPLPESHFAIFPEELVKNCILAGCPPRGIVLDPFAGSGTTGKVAQNLNRKAILIELIPDYLKIIKKRCGNNINIINL
ncbi:site-specific DNA-methyltransferase [Patescibacteria group bacterium]|nr:site-specific DNA-methyltransferase [Patescibacteria group bacterium]